MASISRGSVLIVVVIAVLLAALPTAVWRIIQTGNPYWFTHDFFADLFARLSGPGRMRFVLQPTVAIILGAGGGVKDARAGLPLFTQAVALHGAHRPRLLRNMLASIRNLIAIAILADVGSQYLIFREIHPGAALSLGPVLITIPYALSRSFTNRMVRRRISPMPATRSG
jgi:hypothetical protein